MRYLNDFAHKEAFVAHIDGVIALTGLSPEDAIRFYIESTIPVPWPEPAGERKNIEIDGEVIRVVILADGADMPALPAEYREMLEDEVAHAISLYRRLRP